MSALLEVIVRSADDARAAEAGGADRVEVLGALDDGGMSPAPETVAGVRSVTSIQVRPMLRLREGFGTDGGEFTRLQGLVRAYRDVGADGMVLGYLNGVGEVDVDVCTRLAEDGDWPWTFHRAVDQVFDADRAWAAILALPRVDAVLTAGSARGVEHGLDEVLRIARDPERLPLLMIGGGLHPDHIPWLVRAGVSQFHIGRPARTDASWDQPVDEARVRSWRSLIDATWRHTH